MLRRPSAPAPQVASHPVAPTTSLVISTAERPSVATRTVSAGACSSRIRALRVLLLSSCPSSEPSSRPVSRSRTVACHETAGRQSSPSSQAPSRPRAARESTVGGVRWSAGRPALATRVLISVWMWAPLRPVERGGIARLRDVVTRRGELLPTARGCGGLLMRKWISAPRSRRCEDPFESHEVDQSVDRRAGGAHDDGLGLAEGTLPEFQEDVQAGAVAEVEPAQVQVESAGGGGKSLVKVTSKPVAGVEVQFASDRHTDAVAAGCVSSGRLTG